MLFAVLATCGGGETEPVEIHSDAPVYESLGALVAASDLVVVAEVTAEGPGRAISSPTDPDAAVVTHLLQLRVDEVIRGQIDGILTMEEAQSLADGRAVRVDGQPTTLTGERLLLFFVRGDDYVAIVNGQGRYVLSDVDQIIGPMSLLPVDWTVDELRRVAASCLRAGIC